MFSIGPEWVYQHVVARHVPGEANGETLRALALAFFVIILCAMLAGPARAQSGGYDCSGLPQWKRQAYYAALTEVQYQGSAYVNAENSKRDLPSAGYPWTLLGICATDGGGGGGGGGGGTELQPVTVYGAWHCGDDYCTWSRVRSMAEFDTKNRWLIDRDPSATEAAPSVNLVILSFVHPLRLLNRTNDAGTRNGMPIGMTQDVVDYFRSRGIRVMLSIGGITYTEAWNTALAEDPEQLGWNAAAVAAAMGVGIEIDYEENRNPNLDGLERFIAAYRSVHAYDPTGANPAARLTIDLAAGDRWLIALTERATRDWLNNDSSAAALAIKLDYANAMVTPRQPSADGAIANWQEHVDGKPQYDPPIPPLAPARFTGSLWLTGRKPIPECVDFGKSLQKATADFVRTVAPSPDHPDYPDLSNGMLGFMFWAAECQGTRSQCTTPQFQNSCEGGMGVAATSFEIPIPMPPLRQQ